MIRGERDARRLKSCMETLRLMLLDPANRRAAVELDGTGMLLDLMQGLPHDGGGTVAAAGRVEEEEGSGGRRWRREQVEVLALARQVLGCLCQLVGSEDSLKVRCALGEWPEGAVVLGAACASWWGARTRSRCRGARSLVAAMVYCLGS